VDTNGWSTTASAEIGQGLKRALATLLTRAEKSGAVRRDVGLPEVMTLLAGAAQAAERGASHRAIARGAARSHEPPVRASVARCRLMPFTSVSWTLLSTTTAMSSSGR
jgi:hypothetical protein